jgi:heme-degrading monooxygenase HmoA
MVTIGMNYKVAPGKEDIFENAFNKVVKAMGDIEGHSKTHMFCDINDPQHYLIVSKWSRKAAFDAFVASETFKNVATWGREQILTDRPKHEIYGGDEPAGAGMCPASSH